jgi:glycosyltransferase involved in cell wall biosynthesis
MNPWESLTELKPIRVDIYENLNFLPSSIKEPITAITPVKNEKNIAVFLEAVNAQNLKPAQHIIVDGGSNDGTMEACVKFAESRPWVEVYQVEGNIAKGRNYAIKRAKHDLIVFLDAGCVPGPKTIAGLAGPLYSTPSADLCGGPYCGVEKTKYGDMFIPNWRHRPQEWIPSARAMAVRRYMAVEVGMFPEWLHQAGEDTVFDYRYRKISNHWIINGDVCVSWEAPVTEQDAVVKAEFYGSGGGESGTRDKVIYNEFVQSCMDPKYKAYAGHPVYYSGYKGYMKGRGWRYDADKKRGIDRCTLVVSDRPLFEKADLVKQLLEGGSRVIFVSDGVNPDGFYLDFDTSLFEIFTVEDFLICRSQLPAVMESVIENPRHRWMARV